MLWAIQHFRPYSWGRESAMFTDYSALTWLFKSQAFSLKLRRWPLRLMEHDIDPKGDRGQTTNCRTPS